MSLDEWIHDRALYLAGLKNRTEQQELLLLLHAKKDRTPQDEKKLALIVKAERATVRANKARAEASRLIHEERRTANEAARKARNHRLIQQGLLIETAGLQDWDKGELLRALMSLANASSITTEKRKEWKRLGESELSKNHK